MTTPAEDAGAVALACQGTGIGSLGGSRPDEAARISVGECPDLPFLPELPDRGPGAEMIGRALGWTHAVTGEFAAQLSPHGWQLEQVASAPAGRVLRRASQWLRTDLDDFAAELQGYEGVVKLAMAGPVTLASTVETHRGHRAVSDPGLCRDLSSALADAVAALVAEFRSRLPQARIVVQLDEPALPAAVGGLLPRTSGWGRWEPVPEHQAETWLGASVDAIRAASAEPAVHCCGPDVPALWSIAGGAGVRLISVPVPEVPDEDHPLGQWLDSGRAWIAGIDAVSSSPEAEWQRVLQALDRIGITSGTLGEELRDRLAFSPECGLASLTVPAAVRALGAVEQTAQLARRTWA